MSVTTDARQLFSDRHGSDVRFIRGVGYPQGLRAYFTHSPLLRPDLRVLDAECGTGVVTLALREALVRRGGMPGPIHALAMMDRFRGTVATGPTGIDIVPCNVLDVSGLPAGWSDYDLVVSASMMEDLPRGTFNAALQGLRARLAADGVLVLFMTRHNWLTRPLIGWWWHSHLYTASELRTGFREAGFSTVALRRFPRAFRYPDLWGYVVEASARL